ncbi:serine/threonine-protein kinase [Yinghuangia seranimata]|uniref:serine/threonine-protein kinase n=1 Tax=Yinghuangia seranimata TaxID=408067 RepID=UPI00248BBB1F|nr:serine/threonine-protein kinase [Yinghuangia seranimata]MDI2126822.1 serine/threonine-protein kinase [Yinghuangia seranimata]
MTEASGGTAGRVVNGRYRLGESLGRGGMGTVWHAVDEVLRREVAVKEVRVPDDLDPGEQEMRRERAMREARAAARVTHPNVVTIFDVVEDGGRPWIVMELVRARSLEEVIENEGRLSPSEAAEIGLKVLAALRAARIADVLHRDVKPSNILLSEGGRVVLTDFGIATVLGSATLTATGMLVGSPEYLAPERVLGRRPGPASDLWSLGVTLYQAVEGRSPFKRITPIETLTAVLTDSVDPPRHAGALGPALEQLLRKEPDERPDEAATELLLGAALKGKQQGTGQASAALPSIPAPPIPGPPGADSALTVEDPRGPGGPTFGQGAARSGHEAAAAAAGGAAAGLGPRTGAVDAYDTSAHGHADETRTAGAGHPRMGDTPPPFAVGGFHGTRPVPQVEQYPPRRRAKGLYAVLGGLAVAGVAAAAFFVVPALGDQNSGGGGGKDSGSSVATSSSSDPGAGLGAAGSPSTTSARSATPTDDDTSDTTTSTTHRPTTTRPAPTTTKPTTTTTKPTWSTTTSKPPTTTSKSPTAVAPPPPAAGGNAAAPPPEPAPGG